MAIATFVLVSLVWSLLASASICRWAYRLDVDRVLRATASSCWRCPGDVSILANIDPWQTSL